MSILMRYILRKRSRTKWHNQPFPKESQEKILHPKRVNYRKLEESIQKRYDVPILVTDSQEFYEGKRSTPYRSRAEFNSILSTDISSKFENTPPSFAIDTLKYQPSGLSKAMEYVPNINNNQNEVEYNDHKELDEQLNNISEIPMINESTYSEASKRKRREDDEDDDENDEENILKTQNIISKSSVYDQCKDIMNKLDNVEGKNKMSLKPLKKRKKENELIRDVLKRKLSESITNSQNRSTPKKKSKLFIQQLQPAQSIENELKRSIGMESLLSQELSKPLRKAKSDGDEMLLFPSQKQKQNNYTFKSENISNNNVNDSNNSAIANKSYEMKEDIDLSNEEENEENEPNDDITEVNNQSDNCFINDNNENNENNSNSSLSEKDFSFDSDEGSPKPLVKPNNFNIENNKEIRETVLNNDENEKNKSNTMINTNKLLPINKVSVESHSIEQNKAQQPKATSPFSQFGNNIQITIPNATKPQSTSSASIFQTFNTQNNVNDKSKINFGNNNNSSSLFSVNEPKTNASNLFQQQQQNDNNKTEVKTSFGIKSKGKKLQIKRK